eukprot:SAG11_NODE_15927_length_562_cov_1.308855_1_plen_72_part_10
MSNALKPVIEALLWLDDETWDSVLKNASLSLSGRSDEIDGDALSRALADCGLEHHLHRPFVKGCRSLLKRAM